MDKNSQTHLNTVFDINISIDNEDSGSDHCLEIAAYPMSIAARPNIYAPVGTIDTHYLVALLRIPLIELAWDEQEFGNLGSRAGWTVIGNNTDCWSPEDIGILFGPKLAAFVIRALIQACQNELNGNDIAGKPYRTPRTSGRRGLQRCRALAATLKAQQLSP